MKTLPRLATIAATAALAMGAPLAAAPAFIAHYEVVLAQPTEEERVIAGGVVFACEGTACTGPRSSDRPLRVCSELRREVGTIASFTANGEALSESQLARCNG
ncbi:CC_3452 family protein [Erythrobacter sp. EC-HK427]|uniref:CC_3452 family protein n=1 Tax=Erythrobacter sp. EC-HK427 TaxID=2038396 RepID=UPI0012597E02|nr:hypothetical protein [Erythrobacter sp. EC-HK427]VVS99813.1 conserved exported hypothetical protein [Erythrobacter sp. EC-HK427]